MSERKCGNCQYYEICLKDGWTDSPDKACTAHTDQNGVWCCVEMEAKE